ncbi:MAG: hypothetical protein AAGI06_10920 [Pseudomonadota bacterium]
MSRRRPAHKLAPPLFGAMVLLWATSVVGHAAVSLDGSNCILFAGQAKRELALCVVWEGEGRTLSISLVGRAPNQVDTIVLRRNGAEPFQTLHVAARPPITRSDVGLLYTDMNFDGHGDFAIMRRGHAAVRRPFYYFLYDPALRRYVSSYVLEGLGAVTFDAKAMVVISQWRDRNYRYKDSFKWLAGGLRLHERERSGGTERRCVLIAYRWFERERTAHEPVPCKR